MRPPEAAPPAADLVARLQPAFNSLGYTSDAADGVFSPETRKRWQRSSGRSAGSPPNGEPDRGALEALTAALEVPDQGMGGFVKLQDGSIWQVDSVCKIDTAL